MGQEAPLHTHTHTAGKRQVNPNPSRAGGVGWPWKRASIRGLSSRVLGWLSQGQFLRTPSPAKESCLDSGSRREKAALSLPPLCPGLASSPTPQLSVTSLLSCLCTCVRACVHICVCACGGQRITSHVIHPQGSFRIITTSAPYQPGFRVLIQGWPCTSIRHFVLTPMGQLLLLIHLQMRKPKLKQSI